MSLYDVEISHLDGRPFELETLRGRTALIVNVASQCGLTPQYEALQRLHDRYAESGFTVIGVPCNQFGEQEPGNPQEITNFCSHSYAVTFPLTEKVDVNGRSRHPLYHKLTEAPDHEGRAGDVQWNFEKFLVSPQGDVVARFRPLTTPDSDEIRSAIEATLPLDASTKKAAMDVQAGDVVKLSSGTRLAVTRVETPFLGRDDLLCLIEDSAVRWLAIAVPPSAELTVSR